MTSKTVTYTDDAIFGSFGLNLTNDSITAFVNKIFNYTLEEKIHHLVLASDGEQLSKFIINDIVAPTLDNLEVKFFSVERPCSLPELEWVVNEGTLNTLGLYISANNLTPTTVYLYLRQNNTEVLQGELWSKVKKHSSKISIFNIDKDPNCVNAPSLNIDGYIPWLLDRKLFVPYSPALKVAIDGMFGSVEPVVSILKAENNYQLEYYNPISDIPRILNYVDKPTGDVLKWYTPKAQSSGNMYFFAINRIGTSLGIYDLKQNVELSKPSVAMLLLTYFYANSINGTVLLSKALSSRVSKLAKQYGFNVKRVDAGVSSLQKAVEKYTDAVLYADEDGRYWFKHGQFSGNPLAAISYIVNTSQVLGKSPGEIIDDLNKTYHNSDSYNNHIMLSKKYVTKDKLSFDLRQRLILSIKKFNSSKLYDYLTTKEGSTLVIRDNLYENIIEVYIESTSLPVIKVLTETVEKCLSGGS